MKKILYVLAAFLICGFLFAMCLGTEVREMTAEAIAPGNQIDRLIDRIAVESEGIPDTISVRKINGGAEVATWIPTETGEVQNYQKKEMFFEYDDERFSHGDLIVLIRSGEVVTDNR